MAKAARTPVRPIARPQSSARKAHIEPTPIRPVVKPAAVPAATPASAVVTSLEPVSPKPQLIYGPTWTPEQSAAWLEGVTFTKPASYRGRREIRCVWPETTNYLTLVEYTSGEWTIERQRTEAERKAARGYAQREALDYQPLPLATARVVVARELKGLPRPATTVTHYSGGLPLKRERHWVTRSRDIMAEARARVRSGEALKSLSAECELIIHWNREESSQ